MTYALLMKMVASAILAASLAIPQTANSTDPVIEYPAIVAATSTPSKVTEGVVAKIKKIEDCTEFPSIIKSYDWPYEVAMQICKDESHGGAQKINWNDKHYDLKGDLICVSSRGLFQIGCLWPEELGYTMEDLLVPEKNVAMAYAIWKKQGFRPWTTYVP
jgi:hypothetical protein